jgi:hypothetical protein
LRLATSFLEFDWVSSSFVFSLSFLPLILLWVFSALLVLSETFFPSFGFSSRSMLLGFVLRGFIFC